ncbi:hypothetical protein [Cupriavidus sp. CP313]
MSVVKEDAYNTVSTTVAGVATALWFWALREGHLLELPRGTTFGWLEFFWTIAGFALTVFFAFRWLFESWLWRWRISASLLEVPDLSGAWSATLESVTFGRIHHNVVIIERQFARLFYQSTRQEDNGAIISNEKTVACTVRRNAASNHVELVIVYGNVAGAARDEFGYDHEGCALLELLGEDGPRQNWVLQGKYWANKRYPAPDGCAATRGNITLRWAASAKAWQQEASLQKQLYALTTTANVTTL